MRCFENVSVGFPAGASAYHTKDNWQNTNWVLWSSGQLRIDAESFALIFSPAGCGGLAAKPLGCLVGAAACMGDQPGAPGIFVATTNDPVHGLVRFTFQSRGDEETFEVLAQAAELSNTARYKVGRRSSVENRRRSSFGGASMEASVAETIAGIVSERHPGCWTVVFTGVELYGPDPCGDQGSEVLLARGAVVLLDPQDMTCVGAYELFFYEESSTDPSLRMPIYPSTKLTRQPLDVPYNAGRLSVASRRLSIGGPDGRGSGAVTVFDLAVPGAPLFAIAFDTDSDASSFERDFRVRHRLVALSLKTSQGLTSMGALQEQLLDMRRRGLLATAQRFLFGAIQMFVLGTLLYGAMLYYSDPSRPVLETVGTAVHDVSEITVLVGSTVAGAGAAVCSVFMRVVPATGVENCVTLPDSMEVRSCVAALLATG